MRSFTLAALLASVAPLTAASAQEVTLTVHHFFGPQAPAHAQFIEPWAREVEEASGGRIAVEIFPTMSMGGRPPELYGQARDGFADIVWTLIGYTPGVFPRAEVFELPTIHQGSAEQTNQAIYGIWDMIEADFEDVHPILVHVHAGNLLHLRGTDVEGAEDVSGLKLRTPSRTGAWMIEAWNAEPVGMPLPELPQALSRGVVDGALVPYEALPAINLHQITDASVEGHEGQRFGTSIFLFAMNKDRYEALPEDLRAVIDAHSGAEIAGEVGALWDGLEARGRELQEESGGETAQLSAEATEALNARAAEAVDRWAAESEAIGGAALVDAARQAIAADADGS
jgi:TRAP-type C4-dicarboxylate transport system substrate-binding protein